MENYYKIILAVLLGCMGILPAGTDSLLTAIQASSGTERVYARLDYARSVEKSNQADAIIQCKLALQEARSLNKQILEARALYTRAIVLLRNNRLDDSTANYLKEALPLARAAEDYELSGQIQSELGKLSHYRGDNQSAMDYFNRAIEDAKKVGNNRLLGTCNSSIGNIFRVLGAYDEALGYAIRAKNYYIIDEYTEGAAWISYTLGRINRDLNIFDEAEAAFKESLEIYQQIAQKNKASSLGVALCLDQLGLIYLEQGEPAKAKPLIEQSLEIYSMINSPYGASNAKKNLGKIEYALGNHQLSMELLQEALQFKRENGDAFGIPGIYEYLGLVLIANNQLQAGIDSLLVGLNLADLNKQRQIQYNLYNSLGNIYEQQGDYRSALGYYKKQFALQDSIVTNPVRFRLPELKAILEMEEHREQIEKLEQKNEIIELKLAQDRTIRAALLFGSAILVVFSGLVLVLYGRNKQMLRVVDEQRQELENLVATRDKLFSIISHDLRGSIGNMLSFSEIILEDFDDFKEDDIKAMLASISKTSASTFQLLENLLSWTLSQTNKLKAEKTTVTIQEMLRDSIILIESIASNKNVQIQTRIDPDLRVRVDQNMMSTVFRNLLNNAVKFSHRGDKVEINTGIDSERVRIDILDHGLGISEDKLDNLFTITGKKSKKGTEGEGGSGLGLILCKEFTEENGGQLLVNSTVDVGSTFSVLLPRAA